MNKLGNINFRLYDSDECDDSVEKNNISYEKNSKTNYEEEEIICEYNNDADYQNSTIIPKKTISKIKKKLVYGHNLNTHNKKSGVHKKNSGVHKKKSNIKHKKKSVHKDCILEKKIYQDNCIDTFGSEFSNVDIGEVENNIYRMSKQDYCDKLYDNTQMNIYDNEKKNQELQNKYAKIQQDFTKLQIIEKHDILDEISKIYKSFNDLMSWYKTSLKSISDNLTCESLETSIDKLKQSTPIISNIVKISFMKKYGINPLFLINNGEVTQYGYTVSYEDKNNISSTGNVINLYFVNAINFYKIENSIFKFSLIDKGKNHHVLQIGENYDESDDVSETLEKINNVYDNINKILKTFNKKYDDIKIIMQSLKILLNTFS